MPIKVPNNLPAIDTLTKENVFVMTDTRAMTQDVRPLHILLLNLMPTKIDTETQLARLLGNTPLQIELELLQTATHKAHNVSQEHMIAFYKTFSEIQDEYFDGMIDSRKYATLSALLQPTTPTNIPAAMNMSIMVTMFLSPMPLPISSSFSSKLRARF